MDQSDNLKLKTFTFEKGTVSSNEDIIRNIKDENGRLMKLLQEKDFEIRKLKRDHEKSNFVSVSNIDKTSISDGGASMKIIELSKKLRETTSELESFKSKYFQKVKENKNFENEIIQLKSNGDTKLTNAIQPTNETFEELKNLKEKLKSSETKVLELLSTNQNISKDYKIAMKILEDEIGDPNLDVNKLLNNPSNWRGRSQKIISLNQKIEKLQNKLKESQENDSTSLMSFGRDIVSGATSIGLENVDRRVYSYTSGTTDKQSEVLAKMQRERQQNVIKQDQEYSKLKEEHSKLKQISEGLKSRNQSLTNDIKSYKQQVKNMLDKTKNDDELISSLIQRQDQYKITIQSLMSNTQSVQIKTTNDICQAVSQSKQDIDTIDKLKQIIQLKDQEINNLKSNQSPIELQNEHVSINIDFEQLKISVISFEKEIEQLREMIGINDNRYQALLDKNIKLSEESSQLRQHCLQLEREIYKLCPNSKLKSKLQSSLDQISDSRLVALLSSDVPMLKETISDLQEAVCFRIDKIDSLNNALQLMSSAKQEDVAILTQIIDQTRNKFVEGIKKLKSQLNENQI